MTIKNLLKIWSFPDRTNERAQFTLRFDFDTFAKLQALKEIFPTRSLNEIINDIIKNGLSEVIDALPIKTLTYQDIEFERMQGNDEAFLELQVGDVRGLRVTFDAAYRRILESKLLSESKNEFSTNEEATTNA
jgi:hypothetical protein